MMVREAISKKKSETGSAEPAVTAPSKPRKRGRWDLQQTPDEASRKKSAWDDAPNTPGIGGKSNWDETPGRKEGETPGGGATPSARMWDATPGAITPGHATPSTPGKKNRWDMTPKWGDTPKADGSGGGETPGHVGWAETPRAERSGDPGSETPGTVGKRRSRWDETPQSQRVGGVSTPSVRGTPSGSATPSFGGATPSFGSFTPNFSKQTPAGAMAMGMMTPSTMGMGAMGSMTPEQMQAWRWEKEMDDRNKPMNEDELDAIFPQEGYKVGRCVSE